MSLLRVLFWSGVRHAESYLHLLQEDPRVSVLGVAEPEDAPDFATADSRVVAERAGVPFLRGDPAGVPADLAVICTEPVRHAALAERALLSGRHVLVDKPMATTLPAATRLLHTARHVTGTLSVVNQLAGTGIRQARGWVDAGHVGYPRHIDVEFLSNGALYTSNVERPELVADPALSGGGELANFLSYPIDYVRYLTGCEPIEVYAEASGLFFETHRVHGVEDIAVLSLLLEHGVTATITVGRVPYAPAESPTYFTARLLGSHGHLTVEEDAAQVRAFGPSGVSLLPISEPAATGNVRRFLDEMVTDLLGACNPRYTARDGWWAVAVLDAAYRSARSGRPQPVAAPAPEGALRESRAVG